MKFLVTGFLSNSFEYAIYDYYNSLKPIREYITYDYINSLKPTHYIVNCFFKADTDYYGYIFDDQIIDVIATSVVTAGAYIYLLLIFNGYIRP